MVSELLSSAFIRTSSFSLATLGWAGNTIAGRLAVGGVFPLGLCSCGGQLFFNSADDQTQRTACSFAQAKR